MAGDVRVVIRQKRQDGRAGSGKPLLLAGMEQQDVAYREYARLKEIERVFGGESLLYKAAGLLFRQKQAPEWVAVAAATGTALEALPEIWDRDWRQLVVVSLGQKGENTAAEIGKYVEEKGDKCFFCHKREWNTGEKLPEGLNRTFCLYYPFDRVCPEAAVLGATAGKKAGSFSYKNQIVEGLEPVAMGAEELAGLHTAGCYTLVSRAGETVTSEGKCAGGEYLDIVDSVDYVVAEIEYKTQKALHDNDKIPFDNNGIALLEAICVNVLQQAFNQGIIAADKDGLPDYRVEYAPRSETKPEDRAERQYVEGRFGFGMAGAVHYARIEGTVEI